MALYTKRSFGGYMPIVPLLTFVLHLTLVLIFKIMITSAKARQDICKMLDESAKYQQNLSIIVKEGRFESKTKPCRGDSRKA
jgi:hypothetical protein